MAGLFERLKLVLNAKADKAMDKLEDPRDRDLLRQDRMKLAGVMGLFLLANVGWMAWISTRTAS